MKFGVILLVVLTLYFTAAAAKKEKKTKLIFAEKLEPLFESSDENKRPPTEDEIKGSRFGEPWPRIRVPEVRTSKVAYWSKFNEK